MGNLVHLEERLDAIERRNARVELDKKWETSWVRRGLLIAFTYISIGFYLQVISVARPWMNAIVPSLGFFLSTLTLPFIKRYWIHGKERK